jgi:predicted component of type VI protein secretion system
MKHLLLTTIAAVVLVGCGESQPPEPPTAKAPDLSILDAAEKGNIEAVKQHLAAGANVNAA